MCGWWATRTETDGIQRNATQAARALEASADAADAADHLFHGRWRLLYTTLEIKGMARTRLGLRGLVELGDLYQVPF